MSSEQFFLNLFEKIKGNVILITLSRYKNIFEYFEFFTGFIFELERLEFTNSSVISIPLGLLAKGFLFIIIRSGIKTVLDQYEIL